jgi:zinc protease
VPAAELKTRQAVLNGGFGRSIETTEGLSDILSDYVVEGVDPAEIGRYRSAILAVTPAEARQAAANLITPAGSTIVIVGDAAQFLDTLRQDHKDVTVIKAAELDLNSETLR